jgi:hypothetical protein
MNQQFEDTEFNHSLNDLDSHFMWKKKRKQELKSRILRHIDDLESHESIKNPIAVTKNKRVKRIVVPLVASALVVLSAGVGAARIPSFNNLIANVSPEIALMLQPIEIINENNGIKMEVVAAMNDNEMAVIYVTLQDLTGDRIDETLDLYDYSISGAQMFNSQIVAYDETTKTATLRIRGNGGENLNNRKVNFRIRSFLSDKQTFNFAVDANLSELTSNPPQTVPLVMDHVSGGGGKLYQKLEKQGKIQVLKPNETEISLPEIKSMHISNIGIIDNSLHIQAKWNKDNIDDHGYFYFVDELGKEIHPSSINFGTDEAGHITYGNEYEEYIFDTNSLNLREQELFGHFVTNRKYSTGNWNTSFEMKSVQDEINKELNQKFGTWSSNRISISPLGVTLYGKGKFNNSTKIEVSAKMTDGSVQIFDAMTNYSADEEITIKFLAPLLLELSKVQSINVDGTEIDL